MLASESKPKWKRVLSLIIKIYAGFCTVLLTAYFTLLLWDTVRNHASPVVDQTTILALYGTYMAREYPKRGDCF